jgi:hypothetical protein
VHAPRTTLLTGTALLILVAGCGPDAAVGAASSTAPTTTRSTTPSTTTPSTTTAPATTAANDTAAATSPATTAPTCGVDLGASAVTAAVAQLRPAFTDPALADVAWDPTPDGGNYDPCATLSAASVTVQGATGGSPEQVMMFHDGAYQGTGTPEAYGLTTIDVAASTDDTVVVRYRYPKPGESNAGASGLATVRYQWVDGKVTMLDTLPPEITS